MENKHKKMLISHQEKPNEDHDEVLLYAYQTGKNEKDWEH